MEKTGIVKRIDKKIVQQVILSNCFCLRYPLQYTCSYSFTCLPNIQNTARTAWQQGRYSSATGKTHNNCYKVVKNKHTLHSDHLNRSTIGQTRSLKRLVRIFLEKTGSLKRVLRNIWEKTGVVRWVLRLFWWKTDRWWRALAPFWAGLAIATWTWLKDGVQTNGNPCV